jgi:acetyl-CoA acetyltransferase
MLNPLFRTLVKVAVASLVVGTIMAHFGITAEQLMREVGLSTERIQEYARQGFAWAWPNVLLGSIVIIPIWFVVFCFARRARAVATSQT